ncbi:O-succinylbenzoic acid--CoA ligase [Vibrio nigripulchritudo ATCC 27043]|uniref:o-succinylbenzoate--CoA ligase n=1 Tax=Vibrio nigripulchritudo TaxID=28173 RepID=UPI00021C424A|nr:o-succinylbenzoate--CoA ligase [Vibrio nigripulchritudo]EGU55954.1 O-succinylbenzoic acid--CoA ligase [Vibrio nigripulchritudo ATCC 27043]
MLDRFPLRYWAERSPNDIALVFEDKTISWADLKVRVESMRALLEGQGISKQSVVACVGKNSITLLELTLACADMGAIFAPIAPGPTKVINKKLNTIAPSLVYWQNQEPQTHSFPSLVLSVTSPPKPVSSFDETLFDETLISSLIFTSGTTGDPKAVAHQALHHLASAKGLLEEFEFSKGDSWLLSLPLYHVSGLAIIWRWLATGSTLVMPSTQGLIQDLKAVTHASLVSTQLKTLLDSGEKTELKRVLLGGSDIPSELISAANRAGVEVWMGYGLTEAASTVTAKWAKGFHSAGTVLPNRELKLSDDEVWIKGETLAQGYYQNGSVIPLELEDGWYATGDLGQWHEGELVVLGRSDNRFISGGENISCEEIESALMSLDSIFNAIVIPLDDDTYGQRPIAVLETQVLANKSHYDAQLANRLEKFKCPIEYHLMPSEAKEQGGIKISRKWLKDWLRLEREK